MLAAFAAFGIASVCWVSGLLGPLERAWFDLQTRWLEHRIDSDIVIIELDARSLRELGTWPWRRTRHAQLLDRVQQLRARRIFVDIDFSAPSPHPEDDAQLAQVLTHARGTIVLPAFWQSLATQEDAVILSEPAPALLRNPDTQLGSVNLFPGPDGLVREVADTSSMSSRAIAPVWQRLQPVGQKASGKPLFLDYRIAPDSFTHLSYADVLLGRQSPDLSGKTIFIGATAVELNDNVPVPIHGSLPGVVVQAIAYESGRRHALTRVGPQATLAALLSWAILCAAWLSRISWKKLPITAPVLIVIPMALSFLAYATLGLAVYASAFVVVTGVCLSAALLQYLDLETLRSWRALLRLRHQDALLRQIAEVSTDGILTLDSAGIVRNANGAAAAMLGVPLPALVGQPLRSAAPSLPHDLEHLDGAQQPMIQTIDLARADGTTLPVEVVATRLSWEESFVVSISMRDVSARRKREEELHYHATHDSLTQLGNRQLLIERLEFALAHAKEGSSFALLMVDFGGFEQVTDIFGHTTGADLLVELAKRFREWAQHGMCVARMGGDEFALLLSEEQSTSLDEVYEHVRSLAAAPMLVQGVPISLSTAIGVSLYPTHGADALQLLQRADIALHRAKKDHTAVTVYNGKLDFDSPRRLQMVSQLRTVIGTDELTVHFQPKVLLSTGEVTEVEALCRWHSPVFGDVSPSEFMPLIEASELLRPFTEWTLRRSLECCRRWHQDGMPLKVAVNLSARHLQDSDLPRWLGELLHASEAEPGWLELEITESAIMTDAERALTILRAIRQMGISLSIDDFGTGYSSLAYLQKLAVNRLKIDKSFVAGLGQSDHDRLIVQSTIDLAHGLGLQVIAEGVETQRQYDILRGMGCEYAQGYLISRALPDALLRRWYAARREPAGPTEWRIPRDQAADG